MSILIERYKMEFEKYKITLDQAISLGRFYIGTTLVLLGGVLLKRASDEELASAANHGVDIKLLAFLAAIFSVQVMVMMLGVLKSRKKSLVKLERLWLRLGTDLEGEIASEFASHFTFGMNKLYATFMAFAIYPSAILIVSIWVLAQ